MPHFIDFPIRDRAGFEAFRERLDPATPERYPTDWVDRCEAWRNREHVIYMIGPGPFAFCRDYVPFDTLMLMFIQA